MRFDLGRERLARKWKELADAWTALGDVWADEVREGVAKGAWAPLEAAMRFCLDQMDQLEPVLRQVADECGDEERFAP